MKLGFTSASNQSLPKPELLAQPLSDPSSTIAGTVISAILPHGRAGRMASSIVDRCKQKFLIAFGPGDRAFGDADYAPAPAFDPGADFVANALMDLWVPHHAAL